MNVISKWLIALTSLLLMSTAHAQNVHGVLRVVKGDVQIKTAKGQTVKARIGGKVFPKDVVITGKDARAKIVMVDNNEINVSPETQIEIQHYEYDPNGGKKDVLLNVIYGKVRSKVEQKYDGKTSKFQIKTPSAVAGVRGTDFLMGFNRVDRTSQVVTFEGKVEFGMPGPGGSIAGAVMVAPGQIASNNPGQAPAPPAPMPKEDLAKMDKDTAAEPPKGQGPGPGAGEPRAPAADEKKDGEKNAPKTDGPKNDGAKKDGASGGPNAGGAPAGGSDTSSNGVGPGENANNGGGNQNANNNGGGKPGPEPKGEVKPAGPAPGPGTRQPASTSGCTMCGAPPPPPPTPIIGGGPMPSAFIPPVGPNLNNNNTDIFIRDTIKGGQTNLIIKVNGQ